MSHKNKNFIKKNIRDADNIGKDAVTNFMKQQNKATKKSRPPNNSNANTRKFGYNNGPALNFGEPINPNLLDVKPIDSELYDRLNNTSKIREPIFPKRNNSANQTKKIAPISKESYEHLNNKGRQSLFPIESEETLQKDIHSRIKNMQLKKPIFSKEFNASELDYFFVLSGVEKSIELNYIIFYEVRDDGYFELKYYAVLEEELINGEGIGVYQPLGNENIIEIDKGDTLTFSPDKTWYFVQPIGQGDIFETYFTTKGLTKNIVLDSSFHCSFIKDLKLENDNSTKLSLINKVTIPYESLEFKSLKKQLKKK